MSESRLGSFYEGKTPSLVNVHEAYTGQHISMEEAQDLNPKYNPSKIVGHYKTSPNKTQGHVLDSHVKQRKTGTGNYKYKSRKNTANG